MRCKFCDNKLEMGEKQCSRCGRLQNGKSGDVNDILYGSDDSAIKSILLLFLGHICVIVDAIAAALFYDTTGEDLTFLIYIPFFLLGGLGAYLILKSGIKMSAIITEAVFFLVGGIVCIILSFMGIYSNVLLIVGVLSVMFALVLSGWFFL